MTSPRRHGTPEGNAFLSLQRLARSSGGDVQELLILYGLEGFLARVAHSEFRNDFVLKGGVLLAAFSLRRPTKDIDLQARGISNDVDDVSSRIASIAGIDLADGLRFDIDSMRAEVIRDGDTYTGVRLRLTTAIGRSRITIGLDVSFGDPVWPAPTHIALPRLLNANQDPVVVLGYPLPMVIAEKAVTAIERGSANTRWRDFADILAISNAHSFSAEDLRTAFSTVADHRRATLRSLHPLLNSMPDLAQPKWAAWRKRQATLDTIPEHFSEALRLVSAFVDPILTGDFAPTDRWSLTGRTWTTAASTPQTSG